MYLVKKCSLARSSIGIFMEIYHINYIDQTSLFMNNSFRRGSGKIVPDFISFSHAVYIQDTQNMINSLYDSEFISFLRIYPDTD